MIRIGHGQNYAKIIYDHPMFVGGILITREMGFLAHSNGDIAAHALINAILGALALGSFEDYFPNTDPRYKDINSIFLLEEIVKVMENSHYFVGNVDLTISVEKPSLLPYLLKMKEQLALSLKTSSRNISIKFISKTDWDENFYKKGGFAEAIILLNQGNNHD